MISSKTFEKVTSSFKINKSLISPDVDCNVKKKKEKKKQTSFIHLLNLCPQTIFSAGEHSFSGVTKGITVAVPDSEAPFFR